MKDEIIRMAREAGLLTEVEAWVTPHQEAMERFAALVAAAERNAILQMSREQWFKTQADFEEAIRARSNT